MGKRLGIAGFQNTGKSYSRRYIPDGENVMIIAPSVKASYLYTGPKDAHKLTTKQIDEAIQKGTRKMVQEFDLVSPEGKFTNLKQAVMQLPNPQPHHDMFDALRTLIQYKKPGYFKPEHVKGNIILAPKFEDLEVATQFVDKLMPWIHTIILPDFTHFITHRLTSKNFRDQKYGGQTFERYLDLAADSFKTYIESSDTMRKELTVVTEYHIEENKEEKCFELFVPGGKMVKEKFLPSSYYDYFLFTDVKFDDLDDDAPPEYRYVTRKTKRYPEARSAGLYEELYAPNNLQEALTRLRTLFDIPVKYN